MGSTASLYGFTGEQTDPNGLVHLRARNYLPELGVFPSLDMVMGTNRYGYVAGDPINRVDPSGQIPVHPDQPVGWKPPTNPLVDLFKKAVNVVTDIIHWDSAIARNNPNADVARSYVPHGPSGEILNHNPDDARSRTDLANGRKAYGPGGEVPTHSPQRGPLKLFMQVLLRVERFCDPELDAVAAARKYADSAEEYFARARRLSKLEREGIYPPVTIAFTKVRKIHGGCVEVVATNGRQAVHGDRRVGRTKDEQQQLWQRETDALEQIVKSKFIKPQGDIHAEIALINDIVAAPELDKASFRAIGISNPNGVCDTCKDDSIPNAVDDYNANLLKKQKKLQITVDVNTSIATSETTYTYPE